MIWYTSISGDRVTYTVHLKDEDELFFIVPIENDGSDNWKRLKAWLDAGNTVTDDITPNSERYQDFRRVEYPPVEDQFDTLYHGGYDAWKAQIQAVKDKYPKP